MVLQTPRPQRHPKTGVYRTRVAVPHDLRPTLGRSELIEALRTKNPAEAAARHLAVYARMVATLETARQELGGAVRRVPPREVAALAGEVYRLAVAEAEAAPGRFSHRELALDDLLEQVPLNPPR